MESVEKDIQYSSTHVGEIMEGRTYRVHGNIPENGNLFTVDFITSLVEDGSRIIALRITGKVKENVLARSCQIGKNWSNEEVFSKTPYKLVTGKHIMIEILILENEFLIALNGFHCANFTHRFPYNTIKALEISGDLEDILVDRKMTIEYPQRSINSPHFGRVILIKSDDAKCSDQNKENAKSNEQNYNVFDEYDEVYNEDDFLNPNQQNQSPKEDSLHYIKDHFPVPYFATIDKGILSRGSNITIIGRVRAEAKYFTVTLQTGRQHWPPPAKCYHVKFEFIDESLDEIPQCIVSNNDIIAARRGDIIKLQLLCDKKGFAGFMFDQQLVFRPYIINPTNVNTIVVRGDLKLMDILIKT